MAERVRAEAARPELLRQRAGSPFHRSSDLPQPVAGAGHGERSTLRADVMTPEQVVAILPEVFGIIVIIGLVVIADLCRMIYRDFWKGRRWTSA